MEQNQNATGYGNAMLSGNVFCVHCGVQTRPPIPENGAAQETTGENMSQSSVFQAGAAWFAAAADVVRDFLSEETLYCESCNAKLKYGMTICPRCGKPTGLPDQKTNDFQGHAQESGAGADRVSCESGGVAAEGEVNPRKKSTVIIVASLAVVLVLMLAAVFSGDGNKYADGLVEANNIYGLSTTVTVDEFIYYYNEALSESGEVKSDSPFFEIAGGLVKENLTIAHESEAGAVRYFWRQPLGLRDMELTFWADAENDCIVTQAIFNYEAASNKYGSHAPENAVNTRMAMIDTTAFISRWH